MIEANHENRCLTFKVFYAAASWDLLIRDVLLPLLGSSSRTDHELFAFFFGRERGDHVLVAIVGRPEMLYSKMTDLSAAFECFIKAHPSSLDPDQIKLGNGMFLNFPNNTVQYCFIGQPISFLPEDQYFYCVLPLTKKLVEVFQLYIEDISGSLAEHGMEVIFSLHSLLVKRASITPDQVVTLAKHLITKIRSEAQPQEVPIDEFEIAFCANSHILSELHKTAISNEFDEDSPWKQLWRLEVDSAIERWKKLVESQKSDIAIDGFILQIIYDIIKAAGLESDLLYSHFFYSFYENEYQISYR